MHESLSARRLATLALAQSAKLSRPTEQLTAADCHPILREKLSGARLDRKELQKLLRALRVHWGGGGEGGEEGRGRGGGGEKGEEGGGRGGGGGEGGRGGGGGGKDEGRKGRFRDEVGGRPGGAGHGGW